MIWKLRNWIFILGLLSSGLTYAVPLPFKCEEKNIPTEEVVTQKQELPAATFWTRDSTFAPFAAPYYDNFYFPSLLNLQNSRTKIQLKLQFNIFSQQASLLRQQLLSIWLRQINPLLH